MKKYVLIFLIAALLCGCNLDQSHKLSITVKKTDTRYRFVAEFPAYKTARVLRYIREQLNDDRLTIDPEDSSEADFRQGDTLTFHLATAPGNVSLSFRKIDNSEKNCKKLEMLCTGIRAILQERG